MSVGHRWLMPGGHEALEMPGSTHDALRLAILVPDTVWPWQLKPTQTVPRVLCELLPSSYLHGAIPTDQKE